MDNNLRVNIFVDNENIFRSFIFVNDTGDHFMFSNNLFFAKQMKLEKLLNIPH